MRCVSLAFAVILAAIAAVSASALEASAPNISGVVENPRVKRSTPPAPLGVFCADTLPAGKLSLSLSNAFINQHGSLIGTRLVSPDYIAATTPWYWDRNRTVRLVPKNVLTWTRTASVSYGVTDDLTFVLSFGTLEKNLDAITYAGESGVIRRGESSTSTHGVTDFELSAKYLVYQDDVHRFLVTIGSTFPTGKSTETFTLLQPDGSYRTTRAFYAMQPGTGTYDLLPGATYAGVLDKWSWGLAYRLRAPLAANRQGWRFDALPEYHGWVGYTWSPVMTSTIRIVGVARGPIKGYDFDIRGRAQSANPNFYGGQRVELFLGTTVSGALLGYDKASLSVEAGIPVYQNLNGPALSRNLNAAMSIKLKM